MSEEEDYVTTDLGSDMSDGQGMLWKREFGDFSSADSPASNASNKRPRLEASQADVTMEQEGVSPNTMVNTEAADANVDVEENNEVGGIPALNTHDTRPCLEIYQALVDMAEAKASMPSPTTMVDPTIPQADVDAEQDNLHGLFPTMTTDPVVSLEVELNGEEADTSNDCVMLKLLTRSSFESANLDVSTLCTTNLCKICAICKVMKKVRVHQSTPDSDVAPPTMKRSGPSRFWAHVDMIASNVYWSASQVDGDTTYPIIQALHKGAILDHPFMRKVNKKFKITAFDSPLDLPHFHKPGRVLSPIQAEEIRLNKALVCTASHYTELSYDSKARSKLEALDVLDNICKSLRILWLAELGCRKAALDYKLE